MRFTREFHTLINQNYMRSTMSFIWGSAKAERFLLRNNQSNLEFCLLTNLIEESCVTKKIYKKRKQQITQVFIMPIVFGPLSKNAQREILSIQYFS